MATHLTALGFNSVLLFGKPATDEQMISRNRQISKIEHSLVELAA
jgi:hypothetical protein